MSENSNQPIAKRQFDRVQCAIWPRNFPDGRVAYAVSFSRSYLDGEGKWQRTSDFMNRDLPHLGLAKDWAIDQLAAFNDTADAGGD